MAPRVLVIDFGISRLQCLCGTRLGGLSPWRLVRAYRRTNDAATVEEISMSDAPNKMTMRKARGFDRMEFADRNGVACSLQKSSLAFEDCIWLGANEIGLKRFEPGGGGWTDVSLEQDEPHGVTHIANTRMHLSREQVASLLPYLQRFVETGELS